MGRECRKVVAGWEHPVYTADDAEYPRWIGTLKPLYDADHIVKWLRGKAMFPLITDFKDGWRKQDPRWAAASYEEYAGEMPDVADCMPQWPEDQRTHFQIYETVSEGTPVSPVFPTAEECARWMADNDPYGSGASYEQWLRICGGAYAPSFVLEGGTLKSGAAAVRT